MAPAMMGHISIIHLRKGKAATCTTAPTPAITNTPMRRIKYERVPGIN